VEIDQQVRIRRGSIEDIKESLEKAVFFFVQIFPGENQGFPETIIREREIEKEVFLERDFSELLMAFGHEKQFDSKGKALRVLVEKRQERIVIKLFEDELDRMPLGKQLAKAGFTRTDIAFYADVLIGGCLVHPG
jgi:hypothetical protein